MKPIETRVESVTLYHRGATVRRTAELDFSGGTPPEVFVTGLPLALADHTVRVRLEAEGQMLLLSNVRVGLFAPPRGTPPVAPEAKALREVQDALSVQHDRLAQLQAELDRLSALNVLPRPDGEEGKMPPPAPMGARVAMEQLYEDSVAARIALMRSARDEVKQLEEKQRELQRQISLASTAWHVKPDELQKSVTATLVTTDKAKKARLVLEYFVLGARWAPAYQCRMTRDCTQADLQMRAVVAQRTGEDWRGVTLRLSTASPMSWTELPELGAIRIGRAQPPPPSQRGFRPPPQGASSLFLDYDRGLASARAAVPVIPSWQPPALSGGIVVAAPPMLQPPEPDMAPAAEASLDDSMEEERSVRREKSVSMRTLTMSMGASAGAMPPPAPPPAMAAPAPAPGGRGGPPMKAKKAAARDMMKEESDEFGGGGEVEAQLDVMLYASLRLSASGAHTRGSLTPVDRRQSLTDSLSALGLVVTFDVLSLVENAERQGHELFNLAAPNGTVDVRSEAGWYDYVYDTDAAVDVPSDGTFHSVPVGTRTATSEVLYVCVPREDTSVYRQALVRNPISIPLLPGPVEVSVGGEYVLTTRLPSVAPGGDFKLSLGVEQGIKVARNTKYVEQRSGDKVVATNELIHDLSFDVVNNLERAANCEIRERVPQPAPDAEVVVDEGTVKPPWEPYKQEERGRVIEGGRKWTFTVKPGATQKLSAQYRVKLYANNELVGGNRREA
ncbi:MAG: mucoidy inhibitor MuiA family protein [Archangium sp.]